MYQALFLATRSALVAASAWRGLAPVAAIGALLAASLWCAGLGLGWFLRDRIGGDDL